MKRKIIATLLAGLMTLTLAACGNENAEEPCENTGIPESTDKKIGESATDPLDSDGTLEGLRVWAEENRPEARAGIAYIGKYEGTGGIPLIEEIRGQGYFPFTERYFYNFMFQSEYGGRDVVCVLPVSCGAELLIREQKKGTDEKTETDATYVDGGGMPAFYICDLESSDVSAVITDADGSSTLFNIALDENNRMELPKDGSVFDFTIGADSPLNEWRVSGKWSFFQKGTEGVSSLRHRFWLNPDGYMLYTKTNDSLMAVLAYEGQWKYEDGLIKLVYYPVFEPEDRGEAALKPELQEDGAMTFTAQDSGSVLFGDREDIKTFDSHSYFREISIEDPWEGGAVEKASALYEYRTGHKPEHAIIPGHEQDGILVYLYDNADGERRSLGWYVVDMWSGTGRDYMTGEPLDFSPFEIQTASAGCVYAELENGKLELYLKDDPMIEYYMQNKVKAGVSYSMEGVKPFHRNLFASEMRMDFTPFLFLLDGEGRVYFCDVVRDAIDGSFELLGPIDGIEGAVSFESGFLRDETGDAACVCAVYPSGEKKDLTPYINKYKAD